MKYRVWIEVEEHDEERDTYRTLDGLEGSSVAGFDTEDDAIRFADRLQSTGEQLAKEEGAHWSQDPGWIALSETDTTAER